MKRFPDTWRVATGARWSAWLLVLILLWWSGAWERLAADASPLLFFAYITIYAALWTIQLPRLLTRVSDGSIVVVYDLVLSLLPVWITGGWGSPFLPFALSVLIVPAVRRGWRGGLLVAAMFLALDQLILWTTPTNPLVIAGRGMWSNIGLLGRTLLPFGVVAASVITAEGWRWYRRRTARRARSLTQREHRNPPSLRLPVDHGDAPPFRSGGGGGAMARGWNGDRAQPSTLERRVPTDVQGALKHLRSDLASSAVALTLRLDGDERSLSPQVHALLVRGLEVALDNVVCHARATSVEVDLRMSAPVAVLRVVDDGIGLFDGTAEPPGFHQIKKLRFRVQELGGSLLVEEHDGGGVCFELRVPVAQQSS